MQFSSSLSTQDQLKQQAAQLAVDYVHASLPDDAVVGVGTGSTVNFFIDLLAESKHKRRWRGAISSSEASTARLLAHDIPVLSLNDIDNLPIYVDGADEITAAGFMLKGGGGALTREKIVASVARQFICIADSKKLVDALGTFPIPIEVIPMARAAVSRQIKQIFPQAQITLRSNADGVPLITDNGCEILDISGVLLAEPLSAERDLELIVGVVSVGIFAQRPANKLFLATATGVRTIDF
jgi:ribose 5-phosphate isomerase A